MLKRIIILLSISGLAFLYISCSDRGDTIIRTDYNDRFENSSLADDGAYSINHEYDEELGFSMFYETRLYRKVRCKAYVPPGYDHPNEGPPYPVLYLLAPYDETEDFYFNHGLQAVADKMLADGEIKPMIIVCVNGYNGYGGTFYGNSWAGGRFTDLIGGIQSEPETGSMIDYIDAHLNTISNDRFDDATARSNRAISGVDMGGYGAMRIALTYSENFSAVSALSAPLDFDGAAGNGGMIPLFQQIIDNLDTDFEDMDTSYSDPLRTMIFAAATSFSPHDTAYINPEYYSFDYSNPNAPQLWNSEDTLRIMDMGTYFSPDGPLSPLKYHMPFDATGAPYEPIWSLWLDNNVESILADHPTALDDMAVLLVTTPDAKYNFYQQTLDFSNHLTGLNIDHELMTYSGYDGYEATGERFFYDILHDILKFHSDNFPTME